MADFTKKQKREYLKGGGNYCPACGSDDIEADHFEADGTIAWRNVVCKKCDTVFQDNYEMKDVELVD